MLAVTIPNAREDRNVVIVWRWQASCTTHGLYSTMQTKTREEGTECTGCSTATGILYML